MKIRKILAGAVALSALTGIAATTAGAADYTPSGVSVNAGFDGQIQVLRGSGSDTTYPVMTALGQIYNRSAGCSLWAGATTSDQPISGITNLDGSNSSASVGYQMCRNRTTDANTLGTLVQTENFDHDVTAEDFPIGSGAGIGMLLATVDTSGSTVTNFEFPGYSADQTTGRSVAYARSSREKKTSGYEFNNTDFYGYAKDALVVISWKPLNTDFSKAQLQQIFCQTSALSWQDLDSATYAGDTAAVKSYGIQTSSGTYATFQTYLGCDPNGRANNIGTGRVLFENDAQQVENSAANDKANAIWWMSFGDWQTYSVRRGTSNTNFVDGVEATSDTISDNSYPLTRYLYHVTLKSAATATEGLQGGVRAYTEWLCRNGGHANDTYTGKTIDSMITNTIKGNGFVRTSTTDSGNGTKCKKV
jgi:ABC-type phosphate transport system substrate-binding protein